VIRNEQPSPSPEIPATQLSNIYCASSRLLLRVSYSAEGGKIFLNRFMQNINIPKVRKVPPTPTIAIDSPKLSLSISYPRDIRLHRAAET
jgi:hypothetical protein